jgi:K+-transporting ATPase c subunit
MNRVPPKLVALFAAVVVSGMANAAHPDTADRQRETTASQRSVIRQLLGTPVNAHKNSTDVDLNGDGVVNILDAGLFRFGIVVQRPVANVSIRYQKRTSNGLIG